MDRRCSAAVINEGSNVAIRSEADFNDLEDLWRGYLAGRSLVVEGDVEAPLAIEALGVLEQNVVNATGRQRERMFARYPAILATGLCAIASSHYDVGTFWPKVPYGLRVDANRQTETGKAFQRALTRMGLSRFTTPHRYLGEILMHAGVPLSSIGDLVRTLVRWDDGHTSGDGEGFIRWASSMSQRVAVTRGFDVPTWRFVTEGGEIAEDFLDRVLLAIDDGGASAGLPTAVAEALASELESLGERRRPSSLARRAVEAEIARRHEPLLVELAQQPQRGIRVRRLQARDDLGRAVGRAVVDDDDLVGGHRLREGGLDARPDGLLLVVRGHHDRDRGQRAARAHAAVPDTLPCGPAPTGAARRLTVTAPPFVACVPTGRKPSRSWKARLSGFGGSRLTSQVTSSRPCARAAAKTAA